jgi:hypothetical protein
VLLLKIHRARSVTSSMILQTYTPQISPLREGQNVEIRRSDWYLTESFLICSVIIPTNIDHNKSFRS